MSRTLMLPVLAALVATSTRLQPQQPAPAERAFTFVMGDRDRPMLGVTTTTTGIRDTLGLMVQSVTPGSPADKAGIEAGDRLVSIGGVNLRLSRDDAADEDMPDIALRRLTRELGKRKPGDQVDLQVYRDGQTRTVKAGVVAASELVPRATAVSSMMRSLSSDRAALGVSLGGTGSRRDTLGVLVVSVTDSGPAALAGVEEGDRIAGINGVDLRVAPEDAGDPDAAEIRARRLTRTMEQVKAGDEVELRVFAMGQYRTVRVKTVRASELHEGQGMFRFFDRSGTPFPAVRAVPAPARATAVPCAPYTLVVPRPGTQGRTRIQAAPRPCATTSYRMEAAPARAAELARTERAVVAAQAKEDGVILRRSPSGASTYSGYATTLGFPGLQLVPVDGEMASYFGKGSDRGLLVVSARDGWDALHEGDVLLSIDGRAVRSDDGTSSVVLRQGRRSSVELLRNGKRITVTIER